VRVPACALRDAAQRSFACLNGRKLEDLLASLAFQPNLQFQVFPSIKKELSPRMRGARHMGMTCCTLYSRSISDKNILILSLFLLF
jgi:hypothetical protein